MIFVYQGEPAVIFTNSFQHCKLTWAFHVRCTSLWYGKERGSWLLLFLVSSWGMSSLCPLLKQRSVSRTGVALASSTSCLLTQIWFKSYKNQMFLRRTAISLCCVWCVCMTPVRRVSAAPSFTDRDATQSNKTKVIICDDDALKASELESYNRDTIKCKIITCNQWSNSWVIL